MVSNEKEKSLLELVEMDGDLDALEDLSAVTDTDSDSAVPPLWVAHLAIVFAQCLFGSGSVVGRLGLPSVNPILFALLREGSAGPILCALAWYKTRTVPRLSDWRLFLIPGFSLYLTQLFFITGLKLSSSVTASAWQPSMPIFAVIMGLCLGTEKNVDSWKLIGLALGISGALFMVLFHTSFQGSVRAEFGGSICFFINCLAFTTYFISSRRVCRIYPSAIVTGYSYIVASISIAITALTVSFVKPALDFICSDCGGRAWHIPVGCVWAVAYWSLLLSVLCYSLLTWANQFTDPSITLGYSVLQPLTAAVMSEVLVALGWVQECHGQGDADKNCLYGASLKDLGAFGIVLGLYCIIHSDWKYKRRQKADGIYARVDPMTVSATLTEDNVAEFEELT